MQVCILDGTTLFLTGRLKINIDILKELFFLFKHLSIADYLVY